MGLADHHTRNESGVDLVRAAIGASVQRLLLNDSALRIGDDPEGVHQARVATRRLRSDLRTFGPVLDELWRDALRADLERLGSTREVAIMARNNPSSKPNRNTSDASSASVLRQFRITGIRAAVTHLRQEAATSHHMAPIAVN